MIGSTLGLSFRNGILHVSQGSLSQRFHGRPSSCHPLAASIRHLQQAQGRIHQLQPQHPVLPYPTCLSRVVQGFQSRIWCRSVGYSSFSFPCWAFSPWLLKRSAPGRFSRGPANPPPNLHFTTTSTHAFRSSPI
jgi:hypothetical protein